MASFHTRAPSPPLSSYVDCRWLHEDDAQPHWWERALPAIKSTLWVDLGGDEFGVTIQRDPRRMWRFGGSALFGPRSTWNIIEAGSHVSRMGVQFKPGAAAAFFTSGAQALLDRCVTLDTLWGSVANELRERLLAETTPVARFHSLERTLLSRHAQRFMFHPAVSFALREFRAAPHTWTIAQVVESCGLSPRYFIEVFRRDVGMAPKLFYRLSRFLKVVQRLRHTSVVNWAEIGLACGYFDQSHLTRDFREFAGIGPTAYLSARDARFPTYLPYTPGGG